MATILDITALENFSLIFTFLFIFCAVFGVFVYSKFLGDNKALSMLLAALIAIMTLFSSTAVTVIGKMAPWFVLFFIFILFVIMAFKIFGTTDTQIMDILKSDANEYIVWWIVAIALIIGLGSLASTVWSGGAPVNSTSEIGDTGSSAFWGVLFHPKVLGLALILLVAMFAMKYIANTAT